MHATRSIGASVRRNTVNAVAYANGIVRKHKPDYSILTYTSVLIMIGLIIIFAIGPQRANLLNESYGGDVSGIYFVIKQLASVFIAVGAFVVTGVLLPFRIVEKHAGKVLILGILACILLFVTGNLLHMDSVAKCTLGACRWFNLPGGLGTLQPAEIVKFGLLIYLPGFIAVKMKKGEINDVKQTLIPLGILVGLSEFFIVFLQKDLGTGISLLAVVMAMIVASTISFRLLAIMSGIVLALGVIAIVAAPHRLARIATFMQGDEASLDDPAGYHIVHAKIAIGSGGVMGVGIGNSIQAAGYLPEAINDSVFAVLGETFGFVGLVFILAMFFMLLIRILNIASALQDDRHRLIVIGVFGWIFSHVIINVGAMTGLIPLTGITLPFLSFGGTSILFIALALGIVFQLSQYTSHEANGKEKKNEDFSSRRRVGRTRYTSSRGSL